MNKRRVLIILIILVILFGIYMLYSTFAVSTIASSNSDNTYNITLSENNNTIIIPSNSSKTVYYHIKNTNKAAVKYGVGYNTSSSVYVFIYDDSKDKAEDVISYGDNKYVKLYLSNSTSSDSSVSLYTMLGYENGGDLIIDDGITLVSEVYSKPIPQITLADYITDLYTNASKSTVTNNSITYNYATSVNLMNDRLGGTTTSLDGGNIRYYGASPNNYIYFNCSDYSNQTSDTCELWRIIGVFDGKVKIIRNKSIGQYSWDSSASGVNSGYGVNEWSQADLMKLLNPGYEGESVGGSLYYNSGSGTCYKGKTNATESCDFTSTGLKNDITRGMIAKGVTWNTGGGASDGNGESNEYSNEFYGYERGNTLVVPGTTCSGDYCNDDITRTSIWTSENQSIALAYPSDYGYAADLNLCQKQLGSYSDSSCTSTNWMNSVILNSAGNGGWLLTPLNNSAYFVWFVDSSGVVHVYASFQAYGFTPVLYLSSDVFIKGSNTGDENDPYRINM